MKTKGEYIKYKLQRSGEALNEAEILIANNFYDAAVSRLYYSAFYAIGALLINMDLNPKTHQGEKIFFIKNLFFQGKLKKIFRFLCIDHGKTV